MTSSWLHVVILNGFEFYRRVTVLRILTFLKTYTQKRYLETFRLSIKTYHHFNSISCKYQFIIIFFKSYFILESMMNLIRKWKCRLRILSYWHWYISAYWVQVFETQSVFGRHMNYTMLNCCKKKEKIVSMSIKIVHL